MLKKYILIAGVNGAGKSTFYQMDQRKNNPVLEHSVRINADEILRKLGKDWQSKEAQFESGKMAAKLIRLYLQGNRSFHQETTLAGATKGHLNRIQTAKENGFYVQLVYIALDSVDLAKQRIAARVKIGGHGIDDELVERRYAQSLSNLKALFHLFDEIDIYDNSGENLQMIYSKTEAMEIDYRSSYPYIQDYIS